MQNRQTLRYVQANAGLTRDETEAQDFGCGTDALNHCQLNRMLDMQILGIYPDKAMNFSLAVNDNRIE